MPNRIIWEKARSSPTLAQLSADAERLFWRLTTVADDHGRFESEAALVMSSCFPRQLDTYPPATVEQLLWELVTAKLVLLYLSEDRRYGLFISWGKHQRVRAANSKYPTHTKDSICVKPADIRTHPHANAPVNVNVNVNENVNENVNDKKTAAAPPALNAYVPRLTALLKGKTEPALAARIARMSYREAAPLLRPHPERLEPLLDELAVLPKDMPEAWYLAAIRGKVQPQRNEVEKRDSGTIKAVLDAAARNA